VVDYSKIGDAKQLTSHRPYA